MRRDKPERMQLSLAYRDHFEDLFTMSKNPGRQPRRHRTLDAEFLNLESRRPVNRHPPPKAKGGGGERARTDDLLLAKQVLSQLSYVPNIFRWWG